MCSESNKIISTYSQDDYGLKESLLDLANCGAAWHRPPTSNNLSLWLKEKKRELKRQSPWHILGALPQGVSWNPGHDVWACLLVSPLELLAKGQRLQQIFATTSLRSAWGRRVDRIIQSFSQIINHSSESLINSASTIWLWPQTCRRKNTRERPGVFVGSWEWRRSLSGLVLGAGSLAGSCVFVINCYLIRFAWFRGLMGNKTVLGPASPQRIHRRPNCGYPHRIRFRSRRGWKANPNPIPVAGYSRHRFNLPKFLTPSFSGLAWPHHLFARPSRVPVSLRLSVCHW